MSIVRRVHFFLFASVIVLAPLPLGSNRPWSWSLLAGLVGLLCVTWPIVLLADRQAPGVSPRHVAVPLAGFALVITWAALQAAPLWPPEWCAPDWLEAQRQATGTDQPAFPLAIDGFAVPVGIMRLLCYAGVLWLALQHGRSSRRAHRLIDTLALAGGVYAAYGLLGYATGNDSILLMRKWAYRDDLTATFVNRNHYATYAGVTLLCAVSAIMNRLAPPMHLRTLVLHLGRRTALFALAAVIGGAALLASGSRAGIAATLVGGVALAYGRAASAQPPGAARRRILLRGCAAVALLLTLAIGSLVWVRDLDGHFADRLRIYQLTTDLIAARPLTGYGLGSFAAMFATVRPPDILQVWTEAHNTYLELALDLGIPAAAMLILSVLWLLWACLSGGAVRQRDMLYPLLGGATTVLVGVHALLDFSLQIPAVTVTWAAILGTGVAQSRRHSRSVDQP